MRFNHVHNCEIYKYNLLIYFINPYVYTIYVYYTCIIHISPLSDPVKVRVLTYSYHEEGGK